MFTESIFSLFFIIESAGSPEAIDFYFDFSFCFSLQNDIDGL